MRLEDMYALMDIVLLIMIISAVILILLYGYVKRSKKAHHER
ncbi:MAG: hypothetical protein ACE5GD_01395 [Candidatus Geothermarchaeales archaeon]